MAGLHTRHSLRRNPPPGKKDELVGGPSGVPIKNNNTPTPFPAVSRAQTPALTPAPTLLSNEGLFQQFMKAYLENQNQTLFPAPIHLELQKQSLKAWFPDHYYRNSHLDCYRFC